MASRARRSVLVLVTCFAVFLNVSKISSAEDGGREYVLTLDHSNFSEIVSKHEFIVAEFYAPWCGHCKNLAPEYEKAASILSSHDPPIILAKLDANNETNKELANQYEIQGFPTLKILRGGGKHVQDYKGPRDADGIVAYLKKQVGPASAEIKSAEDANTLFDEKRISIVGIFPKFSGEEFENFSIVAEKLRSDYDFGHTLDAKLLPKGESPVATPIVRLLKPFDELFVDSQNFQPDGLEKFIEEAITPLVTIFDPEPNNQPFLIKFFENPNDKVMLFLNFSTELLDSYNSNYKNVAAQYKGKGISFLTGDLEASEHALKFYGLKNERAPVIIIQSSSGLKYLKSNVEPDQIASWLKDYTDGKLKPFIKSEPVPETNEEPVKVVVADSLREFVLNSKKNVLLEFYAPWCGHCKKLAQILDEVAVKFEGDDNVVIAKLDATANDIPNDTFEVQGYPTLYFRSASGNILPYDGERTTEDIIDFIEKNRDGHSQPKAAESVKDEL